MQNNQNHPVSKCQMHCFSIKALQKQRRPNLNATVTMCRSKQAKKKKNKDNCLNYDGAIFNKDRCHATPAFILPSEKIEYLATMREFIRDHDKKAREYEEELDDLYVPKPRSKNMYCNVCRENYEEYIDHIKSPEHRNCIRHSRFNGFILDLEKKFNNNERKELLLSSNQTGTGNIGEDQVEIVGVRGRKKIKTQPSDDTQRSAFPYAIPTSTTDGIMQNMLFPQNFSQAYQMMGNLNNCRGFYQPMGSMAMNPYFSYAYENPLAMSYQLYCMPYQPVMNLQVYQQQL